jgi:hypothetical protein
MFVQDASLTRTQQSIVCCAKSFELKKIIANQNYWTNLQYTLNELISEESLWGFLILQVAPLEEHYRNSKKAHFELYLQEVRLRPYLSSGIASHVYFLKWPREGRSVVLFMRLHRPGQWFFLSPEKLCFSSYDSVLIGVRYVDRFLMTECHWCGISDFSYVCHTAVLDIITKEVNCHQH